MSRGRLRLPIRLPFSPSRNDKRASNRLLGEHRQREERGTSMEMAWILITELTSGEKLCMRAKTQVKNLRL